MAQPKHGRKDKYICHYCIGRSLTFRLAVRQYHSHVLRLQQTIKKFRHQKARLTLLSIPESYIAKQGRTSAVKLSWDISK